MTREAWIVVDLGFGDAGKGATVDFLVRDRSAGLVVRFNGGAQAGHNVVTPDGRHHTFAQFGAGSLVPGTRTLLGPAFVFHPGAMLVEAARLAAVGVDDALERTTIDEHALVISPFQQAAGRLRELRRGEQAHGTCGVGVGEAVSDAIAGESDTIRARDLRDADALAGKLESQKRRKLSEFHHAERIADPRADEELSLLRCPDAVDRIMERWQQLSQRLAVVDSDARQRLVSETTTVVFEGAQGVLLDQDHGFHPHTTWSECTPRGAMTLLRNEPARVVRLGVTRAYMVRHGSGPFPTHDPEFDVRLPDPHNDDSGWQGQFRRGPLDLVLLRYALQACGGVDALALTCLDQVGECVSNCRAYECDGETQTELPQPRSGDHAALARLGNDLHRVRPVIDVADRDALPSLLVSELGLPVALVSHGPTANDRRRTASSD